MPTEDERRQNAPDTSEQYERANPYKEPGLGRMDKTDNTPHEQPDQHEDSRDNDPSRGMELHADETQDLADSVDPTDPHAYGDRQDATPEEAIGRDPHPPQQSQPSQQPARRQERP